MRLRSIVIALLLMSFFSTAAGAIYIEGQPTPDDGLIHIMDAGSASPALLPYNMAFPSFIPGTSASDPGAAGPMPMPASISDISFLTGMPEFDWGTVSTSPGSVPPSPPVAGYDTYPMLLMPPPDSEGNIIIGDTIGHIATPPSPGYWDDLQDKDLHTNMPLLTMPAMFGL